VQVSSTNHTLYFTPHLSTHGTHRSTSIAMTEYLTLYKGPVGILCAYSALFRGANRVYIVDRVPKRLAKAKTIGAIPIDFSKGDPVAQILKFEPDGVDRSCDCVGFECVNAEGMNVGNTVITEAIAVTRNGGGIGLIGVYSPIDNGRSQVYYFCSMELIARRAGSVKATAKKGLFEVPIGTVWLKSQLIRGGLVPLRTYQPTLKKLIESGRMRPSFIFDKGLRINDAPKAYAEFSNHDFIKGVILFEGTDNGGLTEDGEREQHPLKKRKRNSVYS
jgi:threonine dehydrogenase-like Zn-dependent dehydrogenase